MPGARGSRRWRALSGCIILLLLTGAFSAPGRGDVTAGTTRVVTLAPAEFRPVNNGQHFAVEQGGLGRLCATSGSGYFVAPLQLADGAAVERIAALVRDKSRDSFALLSLVRRTPEKSEIVAATRMSTGRSEFETLSAEVQNGAVDTQRYSYLLQLVLTGPNVCLYGAQVDYREK